jgi:type IV pilus assembly protein PilY1
MMKSIKNLALTTGIITAMSLTFSVGHADDRDIYITDTASANTANHNILFVMDTSGSMGDYIAALSPKGDYDPTIDYGDSPDKIYVYGADGNWTGQTIETSQNKCTTMTNAWAASTGNPIYQDFALQWLPGSVEVDNGQTCGANGIQQLAVQRGPINVNVDQGDWKQLQIFDVEPNRDFSITISSNRNVTAYVSSYFGNNNIEHCSVGPTQSYTCEGNTGDRTTLDVWVKRRSSNSTTAQFTGYVNETAPGECTDNPDTVLPAGWNTTFADDPAATAVLECKNDRERHGIDEASQAKYVTSCPFGQTCTTPTYSANESEEIDWSNAPLQYFVPANFHDYRQRDFYNTDGVVYPVENPDTFCDRESRLGTLFNPIEPDDSRIVYECFTLLGLMQNTVSRLVESLTGSPINVGLMRFNKNNNNDDGGTIVDAVQSIDTNTDFITKLNNLEASGATPLSEVMYEAYLYFKGSPIDEGFTCTDDDDCTDSAARAGNNYISPIIDSCQKHNIVLLTDGEPTDDGDRDTQIKAAAGVTSCGSVGGQGKCLDEIAKALSSNDLSSTVPTDQIVKTYTIGLEIDLPILQDTADEGKGRYYTADNAAALENAFRAILQQILADASSFAAPAVSVNAFNELKNRNEIYYAVFEPARTPRWQGNIKKYKLSANGTIKDALGANAISPVTGFFKDGAQSIWSAGTDGKDVAKGGAASKLTASRNVYTGFVGADNNIPVKLSTANFSDIAPVAIGAATDEQRDDFLNWLLGSDVFNNNEDGDSAQFLSDPLHSRPVVITYKGTPETGPKDVLFFASNLGSLHAVDPADDQGTELWAHLPAQHQNNIKNYITAPFSNQHTYGLDGEITVITTEAEGSDSTDFELDSVQLYIGERRGGSRYYGFDVSNALIDQQITLDDSYDTPFKKLWTITGAIESLTQNFDGPANIARPESADSGFRDLGQTWSKMEPAKLKSSTGTHNVLIFSGGYDPRHDDSTYAATATAADYGNAIYIIDALTGNLLYSIGNNNDDDDNDTNTASSRTDQHKKPLPMIDSIVASPKIIDVDGDGFADIIFAIDIMGHIWRIDINADQSMAGASYVTAGMIADLSSATSIAASAETLTESELLTYGPRRFYNSVDVSRSNSSSGSDHLNLVVGSGYRASPSLIETLNNRLYILFDEYPEKRELGSALEANRYNYFNETVGGANVIRAITAADLKLTSTANPESKLSAPYGFYRQLSVGEKTLQKSTTFNNVVSFSTFRTSPAQVANNCGGGLGSGAVYALDLNTGASALVDRNETNSQAQYTGTVDADGNALDANGDVALDEAGQPIRFNAAGQRIIESIELKRQGIPAESTFLLLPELTVCIGTECNIDLLEDALLNGMSTGRAYRSFWRER